MKNNVESGDLNVGNMTFFKRLDVFFAIQLFAICVDSIDNNYIYF